MKRFRSVFLSSIIIASLSILSGCQSTKSATSSKMLKFNYENGKGYDYEMISNIDQTVMGSTQKIDLTTYYSMNVIADNGSEKTIRTSFERFKMNMQVMGVNIDVDTDVPVQNESNNVEENPLTFVNRIFSAVKGQKFVMKIDEEGKVLKVEGFKEMAQSIADSMNLNEERKAQMIAAFNQQFNEKNTAEQFERILYIFPNKMVKVGDSWDKKTTTSGPMGGVYNSTYIVKDIEGDMVTLEESTRISALDDDQRKMEGTQTGTMIVDSRSGLVVSANSDLNISSTTGNTKIEMKGKTKIKGKAIE